MKRILFFAGLLTANVLFAQTPDAYTVKSGDDLSKIARMYHVSVDQMLAANPQVKGTTIKVGEELKIPNAAHADVNSSATASRDKQPIFHVVEKGETLSSLSRTFHVKVAELQSWNHLDGNDIKVGQKLIVSSWSPTAANSVSTESHAISKTDTDPKPSPVNFDSIRLSRQSPIDTSHITYSTDLSSDQLQSSVQKGIATWTKDQNDGGNYYALSSNAPVGSMVIVKNLMNDKTIRVKVIGKLPDADKAENAIIKVSYSAAQGMNVLDDRFLVQLIYPASN